MTTTNGDQRGERRPGSTGAGGAHDELASGRGGRVAARVDGVAVNVRVREILNRRPTVGLALGVVHGGSLELLATHGVAEVASRRPISEDTVLPIASITKTFTAIAVMQLWEQGVLELDAPVNDYLRAYELVPARPEWRPASVRHLLTHTAGIGEVVPATGVFRPDFGETVKAGRPVPSLAEHYRGGLRIDAEPGTRFRYGNHSPATLGQIVEDVTGEPLDRYLRERLFRPLGMHDTALGGSALDTSRVAVGYALRSAGPTAVPVRAWVTAGAAAALSTPRDMARYVAALLGGGANEHGSVLRAETLADMFAAQYQPHPRVPGVGLAFFRGDAGGHRLVGHQGVMPGFDSQIILAPDGGVGLVALTNGTSDGALWLPAEMSKLLNHLLGVPDDAIRTDVAHRPEVWGDLCGWYALPGRLTDVRLRAMMGAGIEVFVRQGQLMLRFLTAIPALYRGFALHPDDEADPYAFALDFSQFGMGVFRVVFSPDPTTSTMTAFFHAMPVSAEKRPDASNPRLGISSALGVAAAAIALRRLRGAASRASA